MDVLVRLADRAIRRLCTPPGLGLVLVMLAFAHTPPIALRFAGHVAGLTGLALLIASWRAPRRDLRHSPLWRRLGYFVSLYFLSLPSAAIAVQRVAQRVRQGGHDIPEATIRRRFVSGKRLFTDVYQPLVDDWILYDNSGDLPVLMEWSGKP